MEEEVKEMKKDLKNKLVLNMMLDMRKEDIDPFERAKLIKEFMSENNIPSQREMGRRLGVPHSTINDWLRWDKITEDEYQGFKDRGMTHTDVYRVLRDNTTKTKDCYIELTKFDYEIKKFHSSIRPFIKKLKCSKETESIIRDLINDLNRLLMYVDKKRR